MPRSAVGLLGIAGLLISAAILGSTLALAAGSLVSVQDIQTSAQIHPHQASLKNPNRKGRFGRASVRILPSTR